MKLRELREEKGWSQSELGRRAGRSSPTISALEAGRLKRPTAETRAAIADALGEPVEVAFAGFPAPGAVEREARRKALAAAYEDGGSSIALGEQFKVAPSTVTRASSSPRPNLRTVQRGRISVTKFARRHGVMHAALVEAIDERRLPGERVEGAGLGPRGFIYLVDEAQLLRALDGFPRCGFEGCERIALGPSGGCGRGHGAALLKRGPWWNSDDGREFSQLYAAGKIESRCFICQRVIERPVAHSARAWRSRWRCICAHCHPNWLGGQQHVRSALTSADPKAGVSEANVRAFKRAFEVAIPYANEILKSWPRKKGQRLDVATVLVIDQLHRLRFADDVVDLLFARSGRPVGSQFTRTRRRKSAIRRLTA